MEFNSQPAINPQRKLALPEQGNLHGEMQTESAGEAPLFFEVSGWRKLAVVPIVLFLRLWFASLRIELEPELLQRMREDPRGLIFVLWHNRLFVTSELNRRFRRSGRGVVGLVSGSKDGAWLAAVFNMVGIPSVRGSQNRRGAAGARELLAVLKAGFDVGITVDGSRGPVYEAKEGVALLARKSMAPVIFVSPAFTRAWRLKSWDRFFLPVPFSKVYVRTACYDSIEDFQPGSDRKEATAAITAKLRELAEGTDPALGL